MQKVKENWKSAFTPDLDCRGGTGVVRRSVALVLALVMLLTMLLPLSAFAAPAEHEAALDKAIAYLLKEVPKPGYEDEWVVFALARSGAEVPSGYYEGYLSDVLKQMDANSGSLPAPGYATDYSRVALTLTALGIDASDFDGYNLLKPLSDIAETTKQGVHGASSALLALDAKPYSAKVYSTMRGELIASLEASQLVGGGFNSGDDDGADADYTAMVLQGLAPYKSYPAIKGLVADALDALKSIQASTGGFGFSWMGVCYEGPDSTAQVITALTALGIDPTSAEWTRDAHPIAVLLGYQDASGGINYPGAGVNVMSSYQAALALEAYTRYVKDQNSLYDMSDVKVEPYVRPRIDLSKVTVTIANMAWTGEQLKPTSFTYNGKKYPISENATASYGANKNIGKGTVKLTGKGDFTGTKTVTFKIVPKKNAVSNLSVGKKQLKVTWKKVSAKQKVSKYQLRYRVKGAATWKTKTFAPSKPSTVLKGLKKGKTYQVQVRSYKTVAGAKYYSAWSATKLSKKVK